jgi:hypothetical protein
VKCSLGGINVPGLKLVAPKIGSGGIVIIDNYISSAKRYGELPAYMRAEGSGFTNMTIPYSKGLEFNIKL